METRSPSINSSLRHRSSPQLLVYLLLVTFLPITKLSLIEWAHVVSKGGIYFLISCIWSTRIKAHNPSIVKDKRDIMIVAKTLCPRTRWTKGVTGKIRRIHKFDTLETDPLLYGIGCNWMTEFHFIWGRWIPNGEGRSNFEGPIKEKEENPEGTCLCGGTRHGWLPDTSRGHPSGNFWKLPHIRTTETGIHTRFASK